jgi:hypothetical protein
VGLAFGAVAASWGTVCGPFSGAAGFAAPWGWGCGCGCPWPHEFGRGARPAAPLRGCPLRCCLGCDVVCAGGNHASWRRRLELFFAGVYGGAWSGAQRRSGPRWLASIFRLTAGRAGVERNGTRWSASKKRTMRGTLCGVGLIEFRRRVSSSWTVRAERVPWSSLAAARDFACGLPLRSRPQNGSSCRRCVALSLRGPALVRLSLAETEGRCCRRHPAIALRSPHGAEGWCALTFRRVAGSPGDALCGRTGC